MRSNKNYLYYSAVILAGVIIFSSAFHFWPFEDNKVWQLLCPSNLAVLIWTVILSFGFVISMRKKLIQNHLPHISIFAYLLVNMLSLAFSPDLFRFAVFVIKVILMFIGGYTLFSFTLSNRSGRAILYLVATISLFISIAYCITARFLFNHTDFGFFGSGYKYGTYIGMLTPLCATFLILSKGAWTKLLAILLIIGSFVSSGSLGAVCAIFVGLLCATIFINKWPVRLLILFSLVGAALAIILLWSNPNLGNLERDLTFAEEDGHNLRQRYLEWQAQLNLLEERTMAGSGAGCINEYRSKFYYRLPKLNTLKPFDQNGWLMIAAEIGILGLACFCWIIYHYFTLAYSQIKYFKQTGSLTQQKFVVASLAGLIGACVANVFSSVHHNGILMIFVFILVLIEKNNHF
jgi:MFS family permease